MDKTGIDILCDLALELKSLKETKKTLIIQQTSITTQKNVII
jgi:hypothetical protein